jgi:hypothetical protein
MSQFDLPALDPSTVSVDPTANAGLMFQDEPRIHVESEDQPDRVLLETKIARDDGYQKQQGRY